MLVVAGFKATARGCELPSSHDVIKFIVHQDPGEFPGLPLECKLGAILKPGLVCAIIGAGSPRGSFCRTKPKDRSRTAMD